MRKNEYDTDTIIGNFAIVVTVIIVAEPKIYQSKTGRMVTKFLPWGYNIFKLVPPHHLLL